MMIIHDITYVINLDEITSIETYIGTYITEVTKKFITNKNIVIYI